MIRILISIAGSACALVALGLPVVALAQETDPAWVAHPERPYSILATEVTVARYRACVEQGACSTPGDGARCNYGRDRDDHPVNCVSYDNAEEFCGFIGARVCLESEWIDACRGTDDRVYPYGPEYDTQACNSQSASISIEGRDVDTAPVGEMAGCSGGLPGLFDMSGNVAEWVAPCNDDDYCKFRGGGYFSNDPIYSFTTCSGICSGNIRTFRSGITGIRCCRDAN